MSPVKLYWHDCIRWLSNYLRVSLIHPFWVHKGHSLRTGSKALVLFANWVLSSSVIGGERCLASRKVSQLCFLKDTHILGFLLLIVPLWLRRDWNMFPEWFWHAGFPHTCTTESGCCTGFVLHKGVLKQGIRGRTERTLIPPMHMVVATRHVPSIDLDLTQSSLNYRVHLHLWSVMSMVLESGRPGNAFWLLAMVSQYRLFNLSEPQWSHS